MKGEERSSRIVIVLIRLPHVNCGWRPTWRCKYIFPYHESTTTITHTHTRTSSCAGSVALLCANRVRVRPPTCMWASRDVRFTSTLAIPKHPSNWHIFHWSKTGAKHLRLRLNIRKDKRVSGAGLGLVPVPIRDTDAYNLDLILLRHPISRNKFLHRSEPGQPQKTYVTFWKVTKDIIS